MIDPTKQALALREMTHVGVPIRDVQQTASFWQDVLGIGPAAQQPIGDRVKWLELDGRQFHLFEQVAAGADPVHVTPGSAFDTGQPLFVFGVADMEHAASALGERGIMRNVAFADAKQALTVQDPNGYWLCLIPDGGEAGAGPVGLTRFRGLSLPVANNVAALREMTGLLGLRQAGPAAVSAGDGVRLELHEDAAAAQRHSSLIGVPPRVFHLNFTGDVKRARRALQAPTFESEVHLHGGGGACQLFTKAPAARMLIEISESCFADDPSVA